MEQITNTDRQRLRELAARLREIAETSAMAELKALWLKHNMCGGARPMITVETWTFSNDILPPLLKCEGNFARGLEWQLLGRLVNNEVFKDDSVIEPYFAVVPYYSITPFGLDVTVERADKQDLGHHFKEQITDLERDFHLLGESTLNTSRAHADDSAAAINEIFGDILPARVCGMSLIASLTQNIVHIMSMENMFVSMYDYPELFHKMMSRLSDDYIRLYDALEQEGKLLPTTGSESVCQGTYAFNSTLPSSLPTSSKLKTTDVFGYMDSQETVGVSKEMFSEFIFPYYKKVAERFGLLSYGCCEPVSVFWDDIRTLKNLQRVSISPWCDEALMGEALRGSGIVYHRKPSPNFLGVGNTLDEDALRKHIAQTVKCAKGCELEFTQRDVYTVGGDMQKVARYVQIIREETAQG